jgi:hypothetical protein
MKLRRLRHRVFWKKGGLQRPCPDFDPHCVVCRYFRRKRIA